MPALEAKKNIYWVGVLQNAATEETENQESKDSNSSAEGNSTTPSVNESGEELNDIQKETDKAVRVFFPDADGAASHLVAEHKGADKASQNQGIDAGRIPAFPEQGFRADQNLQDVYKRQILH